ncbi:Endo-1,4-beta-xylanase A precursor [Paenibacillus konkukensis]|uniref:Endo-1,4-beta-xylanase A n=1 Tax=Paenibacillus konkukensis TaxID=2020716 RepID=A0ABY4RRL0_9BACL|nr:Ig-like domain-containing protein [Paenibacillus konkukensis]UQZ84602.1 Endo-1,4-beta-xylanase A precursor [Paenibacillus konkukensis]
MLKKQLAILLIVLLVGVPFLGAWPLRAEADYAFSGGGDGSLEHPYVILTAEDLNHVREHLHSDYRLGADIDLSSFANWVPIGTGSSSFFGGNFDGGHYTISNLTIDSSLPYVGLFGYAQSAIAAPNLTKIKNVRLENVQITSRSSTANVGGLAGSTDAWTAVDGVSVSGEITGAGSWVGGITGQSVYSISNSDAHVHINGNFRYAGGLTGYNTYGITESYATGDVTVTGNFNYAGGLVGYILGDVSNSYATGRIEASNPSSSVGGLIGFVGRNIMNSYASGTLIKAAGSGYIGGLVGDSHSFMPYTITHSYWNITDNPGLNALGYGGAGADGAIEKSDMKDMIASGGWDPMIWGIQEGIDTPYLKTFSPELKVAPISTTYDTEPAGNALEVSGYVRDGSIGEPLTLRIAIQNRTDATVTDYVYEMPATGGNQAFNWSTPIDDQRYPAGPYTLYITVEDTVAGHEQQESFSFDVNDVTAPPVPSVTSPTSGQVLRQSAPVISGTAEAGSTVTIVLDGNEAGTVTADASGNWYGVPVLALSEGAHTVQAKAADAAGNASAPSAARPFTVDTIAPTAPSITSPTSGQALGQSAPVISGTAEAGSTVTIVLDGNEAGTAIADASGSWTWTPSSALSEGAHTVQAKAADGAGNASAPSAARPFTVDTIAPTAPSITSPTSGQVLRQSAPVISGKAEAGSTVTIVLDGNEAGTAIADASGSWTWTPSSALSEGAHTVQAKATDAAGNVSAPSAARPFTVDTTAPTATVSSAGGGTVNASFPVTITFSEAVQGFAEQDLVIENGAVSNLVTVTSMVYSATVSPMTSGQAVKVTVAAGAAEDAAGNANPQSNTLLVQYDTTKPVAAFGNFTPGQLFQVPPAAVTVSVYEAVYWIAGGAPLDAGNALPLISMEKDGEAFTAYTASFDAGSHVFTLSLNGTVQDGEYRVLIAGNAVRNVYYNVLDAARASFTIDQTPPAVPALLAPANGLQANTSLPTISGTAEPGTAVTIRLDGMDAATVTAAADGSWTWTPDAALSEGAHTVSASATDAAGNTGSFSAEHTFKVDTTAPVTPVLVAPTNGEWTNAAAPTISGTAEPGTVATIRLDGTDAATVTVAGDGSWSWMPSSALTEGAHTVSAGATDAAGNTGGFSAEHTFTVDTQPPVITLVGDAWIVLAAGAAFMDPGATVTDLEESIPVTITGSVDPQVPGTYILQYDAQDSAGNAAVPVTRTVQVNGRNTGSKGNGSTKAASNNANLTQLIVKANGDALSLTPAFAADKTSYRVETSADEVSIEAVASDGQALVSLGEAILVGKETVALAKGDNVFEIIVKAENGTVKSYSLTVQRQTEAAPSPLPVPAEHPVCTFLDIKGHWAEPNICEAAEKGIVNGHSETEFDPQGLVTRVEFAAMLLRTLGAASGPAADKVFTDQNQIPAWATSTVSKAVESGILQGYPDGSLRPIQTVSRSEMAAMMVRAMKWNVEQGQMTSFADDADIPIWAKGYIYAAAKQGLLNGREGNRVSPSEPATRAEAATILLRLQHVLDDMPVNQHIRNQL